MKRMINVAILEHEKESKEIIFQLGNILRKVPWTFRHYYKASELAKAAKEEDYQIFIFDEMFRTPRFESVFVHDHPAALIIYVCADPHSLQAEEERERVLYISKNRLIPDLQEIADKIQSQARQEEIYPLRFTTWKSREKMSIFIRPRAFFTEGCSWWIWKSFLNPTVLSGYTFPIW